MWRDIRLRVPDWLRRLPQRQRPIRGPGQTSSTDLRGVSITLEDLIRLRAQAAGLGLSQQNKVRSAQAGGYVSPYRGRGIDFEEARIYQPGDDIRCMDWRVTARSGRPHTKVFREERERPVLLLVDRRANMDFGTRVAFKSTVAAQAAALLGWAAADNGDRVGALVFSDTRHWEIRPAVRHRGALGLCKALSAIQAEAGSHDGGGASAITAALNRLAHITRPGSLVFLLSDFRGLDREGEQQLVHLSRHSDAVVIFIHDPLEANFPEPGRYPVSNGRASLILDTTVPEIQTAYQRHFRTHQGAVRDLCRRQGMHFLSLATDQPVAKALRLGLQARHGHPKTLAAAV